MISQFGHVDRCFPKAPECGLLARTLELLSRRGVLRQGQHLLTPDAFRAWKSQVLFLQRQIYQIDAHFEQNCALDRSLLEPLWSKVEDAIRNSSESVYENYTSLREYELYEARIHAFDAINTCEFGRVSRAKSSDVGLARSLISEYDPRPIDQGLTKFYSAVDQCNEFLEDVLDLFEDGSDWNLNLWMYEFMRGGDASEGVSATYDALRWSWRALDDTLRGVCASNYGLARLVSDSIATAIRRTDLAGIYKHIVGGNVVRYRDLTSLGWPSRDAA